MLVYLNYKIVTWIVWQVLLVAERSTCNQLPWYEEIDNLLQNYRSWYEAVFSTSLPPFRWDFCAWQVDMEENVADIMYQPILHLREYFNPVPILNSYKWISGYSSLNQGWTSDSVSFGRGWVISYKWGFKVHCWYSSRKTRYTVINNSKNTVSVKAWKSKLESETRSAMDSLDPMDCSPPGSSVHGISQERTLESSQPRDQTHISCISGRFRLSFLNLYLKPLQLFYQLKHDKLHTQKNLASWNKTYLLSHTISVSNPGTA